MISSEIDRCIVYKNPDMEYFISFLPPYPMMKKCNERYRLSVNNLIMISNILFVYYNRIRFNINNVCHTPLKS